MISLLLLLLLLLVKHCMWHSSDTISAIIIRVVNVYKKTVCVCSEWTLMWVEFLSACNGVTGSFCKAF